jgi:hypothetical protein
MGDKIFRKKDVEPELDVMKREVKEETFLSLHRRDIYLRLVTNYDMCFLTNTLLPYRAENTKLCIDDQDIDIYGQWAYEHGIDQMSSKELLELEDRIVEYRKDKNFNLSFVHRKIAIMLLGDLDTLLEFYTQNIITMQPAPHSDIRPNDFAILLVPLRFMDKRCRKFVRKASNMDRRKFYNTPYYNFMHKI